MRRDERGVSESTQWAILLPGILLCVLGVIQAGLLVHGHLTARQAASAAAEHAAVLGANPADAQSAAQRIAATGGLTDVAVQIGGDASTVDVTVEARVPVFFDLGQSRVRGHAGLPREEVTRP